MFSASQSRPLSWGTFGLGQCFLPSVPQIFSQADTALKRWLLEFAAKRKQAEVQSGIIRNNSIWDELFFNKIQVGKLTDGYVVISVASR